MLEKSDGEIMLPPIRQGSNRIVTAHTALQRLPPGRSQRRARIYQMPRASPRVANRSHGKVTKLTVQRKTWMQKSALSVHRPLFTIR